MLAMATTMVELESCHHLRDGDGVGEASVPVEQVEENEDEDVFFTEEAYEMYSLSRLHNVRARVRDGQRTVTRPRRGRDPSEKAKEKQPPKPPRKQPQKTDSSATKVAKQPKPKKVTPTYSLGSPYPNLNYPTFSRLTIGQHRKFMELQAKYGSKGTRVTTSKESAEHQHWRQLGAMIYQDQQDFNGFAEFAAKQHPEVYMNMPAAAVKYVEDALKANLERVESLPQHYAVLQTFTVNPGVPLPSDPTLQRIGSPVFLGKIPDISTPGLDQQKVSLKRNPIEGEPEVTKSNNIAHENNVQKLAQLHKADIVLSSSSLLTLVNNHASLYEQQWEIPVEVKVNSDLSPQRVVCLQKPLMKHVYYPHEASALYHKYLLKRMLTKGSRERYCQVSDRTEDEEEVEMEQCPVGDVTEECHLEQEERRGHLCPEEEFGEFGAASILDLETFGSELPVVKPIEVTSPEIKGEEGPSLRDGDSAVEEQPMEVETGEQLVGEAKEIIEESDPCEVESKENSSEQLEENEADVAGSAKQGDDNMEVKEETAKMEDSKEMCSGNAGSGESSTISGSEKIAEVPEKRISKVVRMNVRSNSKCVSDDCQASDADEPSVVNGHEGKAPAIVRQGPKSVRMRSSSDSSSDDEIKLTIVTDSDLHSGAEKEASRKGAKEHKIAEKNSCLDASDGVGHTEGKVFKMDACGATTMEGKPEGPTDVQKSQDAVANKKDDAGETAVKRTTEAPVTRMVTRRSARIRQQSSSEDKTSDEQGEGIPSKRQRGRRKAQKQTDQGDKDQGKDTQGPTDSVKVKMEENDGEGKQPLEGNVAVTEEINTDIHVGRRTRSCKKESAAVGSQSKVLTRSTRSTVAERSGAGSAKKIEEESDRKPLTGEQTDKKGGQFVKSSPDKDQMKPVTQVQTDQKGEHVVKSSPDKDKMKPKTGVQTDKKGRQVVKSSPHKDQASPTVHNTMQSAKSAKKPAKARAQGQPAKSLAGASEQKSRAESTIDEIMRLQEKMLTRQKSTTASAATTPPAQKQSGQELQSEGQQPLLTERLPAGAGLNYEGVELEDVKEGNYAYSLWKFGRLRLLVRSKSHGLLMEGQDGQTVASVMAKMESQSELGLGMQTLSDCTRVWLSMYLRPGSKVMRGRIDSRTSEILSWECLDNSWIVQSQQLFNPGMCMKMLYHILVKLAGLSEGRYLLRHRPGDAHVCIYQCMEQAAKNVRASYDLHAAHQAAKLLTSLPPTMPWVPLDPNAPYPSKRWQGCAPLTFPPCPPHFKHPSTLHQHGGRFNKRKKKKR